MVDRKSYILIVIILSAGFSHELSAQSQDRKTKIEEAIKNLSSDSPEIRIAATRKLIELESDTEVEQLTKSHDAEVRMLSQKIIETVIVIRKFKMQGLYKKAPELVEMLVQSKRPKWPSLIGKHLNNNPKLLTSDEKKVLAYELLNDEVVAQRLKEVLSASLKAVEDEIWFYLAVFGHKEDWIRKTSGWGLKELSLSVNLKDAKKKELVKELVDYLEHADHKVRTFAGSLLCTLSENIDQDVLEKLVKTQIGKLRHRDLYMRFSATIILSYLSKNIKDKLCEDVVKALMSRLSDKEAEVRQGAAYALGYFIERLKEDLLEKVVKELRNKLKDTNSHVCVNAASSLARLGKNLEKGILENVVKATLGKIDNKNHFIRSKSASVLRSIAELLDGELFEKVVKELLGGFDDKTIRGSTVLFMGRVSGRLEGKLLQDVVKALVDILKMENLGLGDMTFLQSSLEKLAKRLDDKQLQGIITRIEKIKVKKNISRDIKIILFILREQKELLNKKR